MKIKFLPVVLIALVSCMPAHAEDTALAPVPAETKAAETQNIAVLQTKKAVGEEITSADIIFIDTDKAPKDAITDAEEIIGKAARRPLAANQPIRPADLKTYSVIKKGDMVTIQLQTESMNLTATGKALDNGAKNETVRVVNVTSNRTIFAKVVGPSLVEIQNNNISKMPK